MLDLTSLALEGEEDEEDEEDEYSQTSINSEVASSNVSTSNSDRRASHNWKGFIHLLKKGSQKGFHTFPPLKGVQKLTRKTKRIREELIPTFKSPVLKSSFDPEICYFKSCWKNFTLAELKAATNNFSAGTLLY